MIVLKAALQIQRQYAQFTKVAGTHKHETKTQHDKVCSAIKLNVEIRSTVQKVCGISKNKVLLLKQTNHHDLLRSIDTSSKLGWFVWNCDETWAEADASSCFPVGNWTQHVSGAIWQASPMVCVCRLSFTQKSSSHSKKMSYFWKVYFFYKEDRYSFDRIYWDLNFWIRTH